MSAEFKKEPYEALYKGDIAQVQEYLDAGINLTRVATPGKGVMVDALHVIHYPAQPKMAKLLVERGVRFSSEESRTLFLENTGVMLGGDLGGKEFNEYLQILYNHGLIDDAMLKKIASKADMSFAQIKNLIIPVKSGQSETNLFSQALTWIFSFWSTPSAGPLPLEGASSRNSSGIQPPINR